MRYASIKNYDIANGQGVRVSLFVTGCRHHCPNCFNEEIWGFDTGEPFTDKEKDMLLSYLEPEYIEGLSLLGGEPLEPENQQGLLELVKEVRSKYPNKSVWCYTGFTFEYLIEQKLAKDPYLKELLENIDILVDGPFVEAKYPNKSVWCYTGFTFEYLIEQKLAKDPYLKELLENIDILVDGPFVEDLKNPIYI